MAQPFKMFVIRSAGADDGNAIAIFSHTLDERAARQFARDAAGITDPDCREFDLPADYEAGKLSDFGLMAYEQLIR